MPSIACIGMGNMGAALATTLLASGLPITVWNRTASRPQVKSVIQAGARFEADLAAVIASHDVLVICVLDYATVSRIFAPLDADQSAFAGKTVVNLTNGTPRQTREAAAWMAAHGAHRYFDGAVMVTPQLVGTPHSFLIFSGEAEAIFAAEDGVAGLLKPLGHCLYVGDEAEASASYDLAALAAMYGMFSGAFVGMGLLKKQKRKGQTEASKALPGVEKVVVPLLTALVPYVGLLAKSMDEETWDDNMGNPLGMQLEGVKNILLACKEEGVDGTGLEFLATTMERAVADHGGDGGVAVVGNYLLK
ncbi:NADPH-dependent reductive aminase [Paramyrothecium foliicola]|nr:NADPH-dependent reductive aminase [Paramyrothecium foliicola]